MGTRKVRAVATTRFGCKERTDWHPEGSPEALEAMDALMIKRQTGLFSIQWEELGAKRMWRNELRRSRAARMGDHAHKSG